MSKNLVSALIVAVVVAVWLGSGLLSSDSAPAEHTPLARQQQADAAGPADPGITRVRAQVIQARPRARYLVLRGRTESKRAVAVKAEISGKVVSRPVERGQRVEPGELLCELAVDDREVSVVEAQATLEEARIEYDGALKLKQQGLQSETAIAGAGARLEAARANLRRQLLNLERTRIVAPFGGVIEDLHMNIGDYAVPGASCVILLDLDPMLVRADVTESEIEVLQPGERVSGRTSAGREIAGEVSFVGKQGDPLTRTYPVEATIANPDYSLRSGLTVSMRIDLGEVPAHRISPALFTLNDAGEIGVRIVDDANRVRFQTVQVLEDGPEGVWVTGLPASTRLITVGQELVVAGQVVEPVYGDASTARLELL